MVAKTSEAAKIIAAHVNDWRAGETGLGGAVHDGKVGESGQGTGAEKLAVGPARLLDPDGNGEGAGRGVKIRVGHWDVKRNGVQSRLGIRIENGLAQRPRAFILGVGDGK